MKEGVEKNIGTVSITCVFKQRKRGWKKTISPISITYTLNKERERGKKHQCCFNKQRGVEKTPAL